MRFGFGCGTFVAACLLLSASSVFAVDEKKDLQEILITAQKRVQSAQRVPVSVTPIDRDNLRELGITDVLDLQGAAPGLLVSNAQTAATTSFSIRGVGTSSQNFGLESSVGLYVDGVYRARQSSVINELVDVQAIEVLRGPQGTLFGRNTPSGAIQINSVAPSHEQSGYISANVGNYGLVSVDGAVGGTLDGSKWSFRVNGFTSQRDGTISDKNLGDDKINDRDRSGGKVQLLYTPSRYFSARLIADYSEIDELCCAAVTVHNNFFGALGQPGSDSLLTLMGGNVVSEDELFDNVVALNSAPVSENEDSGVSLEMNWGRVRDLGQLTSITAFRGFDQFTQLDADFSDVDMFTRIDRSDSSVFTQELRYALERDSYDMVIGAYYFDQSLDSEAEFVLGQAAGPYISSDPGIAGLIAAATAGGVPVADITPGGSGSRDFFEQDHQSIALFGQFDFRLTDELTLTTGLRYTEEEKDVVGRFEQDNTGPLVDLAAISAGDPRSIVGLAFPGWGYTLGGPLAVIGARDNVDETIDDDQLTGTVKLSYTPNRETMFYASYGTGYKSGGVNTDRISPQFDTVFGAETSKAFEIGMKRDFPEQGLRVNLSLHNTTTEDFQSVAFSGTGFNLVNAGEVQTRGGELEVWWYPTDTLAITGALIINDGEFESFPGATCWVATPFLTGQADPTESNGVCDRTGDPIGFNPEELFMLSFTKQLQIAKRQAYVHADYYYRSSTFEDTNLDPLKEQDGYGLLNLRAGIYLADGDIELAFWVRNALDEEYLGTYFDVPLQDGKLNSYAQEPRTVGVSLRRDF